MSGLPKGFWEEVAARFFAVILVAIIAGLVVALAIIAPWGVTAMLLTAFVGCVLLTWVSRRSKEADDD